MSGKLYTEDFKIAAVEQVAQLGHPASEVAERLGVSIHSLYAETKGYGVSEEETKLSMPSPMRCGARRPSSSASWRSVTY